MFHFDPQAYGPAVAPLLDTQRLCELGPGRPNESRRKELAALQGADLFPSRAVVDGAMAQCCLAGLWLGHDFLDESHALSQEIDTPSGSYWHALMHRREPDFSNAKYWFRRVGAHSIFEPLRQAAHEIAAGDTSFLDKQSTWDPFAFVDLCEAASGGGPLADLCRRVARAEWELLFDYCYRRSCAYLPLTDTKMTSPSTV